MTPLLVLTLPGEAPPSWNRFYAGMHWAERKRLADDIHALIRFHMPVGFAALTVPVALCYTAFQKRPLDADNVASKLYTDGLVAAGVLLSDDWRHVRSVTTETRKADENRLVITISAV